MSLAVWIGGVTYEIDAARRASALTGNEVSTEPLYAKILEALDSKLVVDVVGGASAGGINGVLLGAAIYNGVPLEGLRETWISIGDFRTLLRSSAENDPPSLMQGDKVVLRMLQHVLAGLWRETPEPASSRLYVYVTATDLFGYAADFQDTGGRQFQETEHRRVFRFEYEGPDALADEDSGPSGALRDLIPFDSPDARELLAHAARASSSFPVAFEAHVFNVRDVDNTALPRSLVDGGILDNQPFNPVLDRVAVIPSDVPTKRVVMYIVPYVTEHGTLIETRSATANDTLSAANKLPRDLPKLQGLERITREVRRQRRAMHARTDTLQVLGMNVGLADVPVNVFEAYQRTRFNATRAVFELWSQPDFRPGNGAIAQHPADDPADLLPVVPSWTGPLPPVGWVPNEPTWSSASATWTWGLSPAERIASWALIALQPQQPGGPSNLEGRAAASALIDQVRVAKIALRRAFRSLLPDDLPDSPAGFHEWSPKGLQDTVERATQAYGLITDELAAIQVQYQSLNGYLETIGGVERLLYLEVLRNATGIHEETVNFPFHFLLASAGVDNSLGHGAVSPDEKLAGMKLNHFGGFLKRSWRANDWLWGRLDGVEHLLRAIVDTARVAELGGAAAVAPELAAVAFGLSPPGAPEEQAELEALWDSDVSGSGLGSFVEDTRELTFAAILERARVVADVDGESDFLRCVRRALARRIQLRILAEDLGRIAQTARDDLAAGSCATTTGAFWSNRVPTNATAPAKPAELVELFRDMHIGDEQLADEASSRLVLDVGSQTVAVAASLFTGDRGGLPAIARGFLGWTRGATLAPSRLLQLVAREPWVGAAAFSIVVGLVVWAGFTHNTLVGATLPAIAILAVVMGVELFTIATAALDHSRALKSRIAAFVVFLGLPVAFALGARWPRLSDVLASWLDQHVGKVGTTIAAVLALIAAGAATARLILATFGASWFPAMQRSWIRSLLGAYRLAILAGLVSLGAGFLVMRNLIAKHGSAHWVSLADEHHGAIFVLAIAAALLLASLLERALTWWHAR